MHTARINLQLQKTVTVIAVALFIIKIIAWYLTGSVAVLTDALESTVNVTAGFTSLFGLYIAAKPRDANHPYGHGKAEFLSAAVEGILMMIAGIFIVCEATYHFIYPRELKKLDYGIFLIAVTAVINYITGYYCIKTGKQNNSPALVASGKHLQSDTWSTLGIVAGLAFILFTGLQWIDSAIAAGFSLFIIYTGYRIVRSSVAGIMDEADRVLLQRMVALLNANRRVNWIDLHNLRIIKYGNVLHMDCHLTVPWYLNVREAHAEMDALSLLIQKEFGESVELFIHADACLNFSCSICQKTECTVRQHPFEKRIEWTVDNISRNNRHMVK